MEFTAYRTIDLNNTELLNDVIECLRNGYDVSPVLFSEKSRENYMEAVRQCYILENYNLSDEDTAKISSWFYITQEIIPAGYDIREFINFAEYALESMIQNIGVFDPPLHTKFDFFQLKVLKGCMEEDLDISLCAKPEISSSDMRAIINFLKENIDMSELTRPEKITDIPFAFIYLLYEKLGKEAVDIFKNHSEFYSKLIHNSNTAKFVPVLIAGQIWGVFEPREHENTEMEHISTVVHQVFENTKRKIIEAFLLEVDKHEVNRTRYGVIEAVDTLNRLEIHNINTVTNLTEKTVRGKYLYQFMLILGKDRKLFDESISILKRTGIGPDEYIYDIGDFDSKITYQYEDVRITYGTDTNEIYRRIEQIMINRLQTAGIQIAGKHIDRSMLTEFCEYLKDVPQNSLPLKMKIKTQDDVLRSHIILEYLQKGINIDGFVPSFNKLIKVNSTVQYRIYRRLADILLRYNINLFPQTTAIITEWHETDTEKYDRIGYAVSSTLEYLFYFLGKPQDSPQYKCATLLKHYIDKGVCFGAEQIRQIYYGILHNVNVLKYANPDYPAELMAVIREGLENNVDLTPYVNDNPLADRLRHQLRILAGMIPQRVASNNNDLHRNQL